MNKVILLCLAFTLTACAHLNRPTPDQEFETYRAQMRAQRDAGTLTVVEEQERLRERYWQIYGKDPESAGLFAFSVSLMRSVQAGDFPIKEADALIAAKQEQVFALASAARQPSSTYDYP